MSSRSRLVLAVVTSALLLPAAPAAAKGIASASVCGADGCTMVAHADRGSASCPRCSAEELMSIEAAAYPKTRAPYVEIVLTLGAAGDEVGTQRLLYAPSLKLAARKSDHAGDWAWFKPPPAAIEIVTRMIGDIAPFPAADMPLGVADLTGVTTYAPADPDPGPDPADAGTSPLLAGAALLAIALLAAGALSTRRRRNGRRALGAT